MTMGDRQIAEVGIFPALKDLAVQTAKSLPLGGVGYLEKYPCFGVCSQTVFNGQGEKVLDFPVEGEGFVLFEVL